MTAACDLCARIERAERGENRFAVARTSTGYVNLADAQYHEGYTIFVAKRCVNDLHDLSAAERHGFLHEMGVVAEAVFMAFRPRKLNYELLGNAAPHLHWHLFPRHADDPRPRGPVWEDPDFLRALDEGSGPEPEQLTDLRARFRSALEQTDLTIEPGSSRGPSGLFPAAWVSLSESDASRNVDRRGKSERVS